MSSIESTFGVVHACVRSAEQVVGYGRGREVSRPRPDALLTLDPTQRPSAPPRWAA